MGGTTTAAARGPARKMRALAATPLSIAWALVLAALAIACLLATAGTARATVPGTDTSTLSWTSGNRVYYGQYNTPIFSATDAQGRVTFAYCVDPTTRVPASGVYGTIPVEEFVPDRADQVRAAMWFGYGGPGFDESMWPDVWNDGTEMTADRYYCETHLILSYLTTGSISMAYYSAGSNFIAYSADTYMGLDLSGNVVNPDSTLFQILARAGEVPDTYTCYYIDCGQWDYTQYIIAQDYYEAPVLTGSLAIEKASGNPAVSDGNPCYSLAGARFGVYADEACTQLVCEITLDAAGRGQADDLAEGPYWVKETAAPTGYALDTAVHAVAVPAGDTVALSLSDTPQTAAPDLLVQKVDAQTSTAAQGTASLAGAEFTVNFYAGHYALDSLPGQPTRSWVFATDDQGRALLDDGHLVGGDALYRDASGTPVLPLGTVTVQETKAPAGYRLSDAGIYLVDIVPDGTAATVATYAAPTVADEVGRGGVSVQKADVETGEPTPQGAATMAGAEFAVVSLNAGPVVVGGTSYAQGERVATLVTDANGYAATAADALPCGLYRVQEVKAPDGYLPADASWDVEVRAGTVTGAGEVPAATDRSLAANSGAETPFAVLAGIFAPTAAYADEAQEPVVSEQVIRGGLRVYKVDADTGTGEAQGDATLENTEFSIVSLNDGPVLVDGTVYSYGEVVKKIYTDANGMAQTGERDLPYGLYTVEETGAPLGYLRSAQFVLIEQDGVIVTLGEEFENDVQRGGILVRKVDADTGSAQAQGDASLAGAQFAIANASEQAVIVDDVRYEPGEVVMTIVTGGDGVAQTGAYDLPFGTYTVTEVAAPTGYRAGDGTAQTVQVAENGVVYELESAFADEVVRGGVELCKQDADTGSAQPQGAATLAGAQFAVANANDNPVVVGGQSYGPGETVAVLTTDEAGCAATGAYDLPYGTYTVTEIAAPEGYLADTAVQTVEVREDGAVVAVGEPFRDQVARGGFGLRKLDAETGTATAQGSATLAGAQFAVVNANANPVVVDGAVYESGAVVAVIETNGDGWTQTGARDLPYGTYTVTEVVAPAGYHIGLTDDQGAETGEACGFTVTVDGDGSWHSLESEVYDQVVRGGIALVKTDADLGAGQPQGDATLAGAQFAIANASDAAVTAGGQSYEPGAVVMTLTTDEAGCAATGPRDLPYGTYTVTEVAAPAGYALDATPQTVTVAEEGAVVQVGSPYTDQVLRGGVSVQKADGEIGSAGPQGAAAYQGAVFEIANAGAGPVVVGGTVYQPGETVARITTDADGYAATGTHDLPYGTYLVREVQAPTGYLVNETVWQVSIVQDGTVVAVGEASGATYAAEASDLAAGDGADAGDDEGGGFNPFDAIASFFAPATAQAAEAADGGGAGPLVPEQVVRGGVSVQKVDAETGQAVPQGGATLAGTQFAVISLNDNPVVVNGTSYGKGEIVLTIVSDETGVAASGPTDLPYGTYSVEEVAPPEGYLPADDATAQTFAITENAQVVTLEAPFANEPVRGGLAVQKVDAESGEAAPLADASLAGTQFAVANANDHAVTVGGASYGPGETVLTLVTDADGRATTGERDLPYGIYTVTEVKPPEGYAAGDGTVQTVRVEQDGAVAACAASFADRVARGDVTGVKVEDGTGEALAGVAFLVTSLTTGESHVLVADGDGRFSTESYYAPHTQNTNANDAALAADGTVADESLLSTANGVWFSGAPGTAGTPDDGAGALPFDVYRFDELVTSASYGHDPVSFEVAVRTDRTVVDLGRVGNRVVSLHTTARLASTGTDEGPAEEGARIVDAVAYEGLTPGTEYELRVELMDRDTGEAVLSADELAGAAVAFLPDEGGAGTVDVAFDLDASQLAGVRAVVFERLYLDGQEVAAHTDIADDDQTVTFVAVGTTAFGATSGAHEEQASDETTIVDEVAYTGLTPGRSYRVEGVLMDRQTGEPLLDAAGNEVTADAAFEPKSPDGVVELAFSFDGSLLAGTSAVAFETLSRDGVELAVHADLDDEGQTVALLDIGTTAVDKATGTHASAPLEHAVIVDTVRYEGLEPGEEYVLEGVLVLADDGAALVDGDGRAVTSSVEFVPESPQGAVEVEFAFDASTLEGRSVVVFENLVHGDTIVASHADLDDEGQTVSWPVSVIPRLGQDGMKAVALPLAAAGMAASAAGAAILLVRRRRRAGERLAG